MICPICGADTLTKFYSVESVRGVECQPCKRSWWSDSFSAAVYEAERKAVEALFATLPFPTDAVPDEEKELEHESCPNECDACDRSIRYIIEAVRDRPDPV